MDDLLRLPSGEYKTSVTSTLGGGGGGQSVNRCLELVNMQMNLKTHIVKIICFALDRGGEGGGRLEWPSYMKK